MTYYWLAPHSRRVHEVIVGPGRSITPETVCRHFFGARRLNEVYEDRDGLTTCPTCNEIRTGRNRNG